jgi:hypothetical protein
MDIPRLRSFIIRNRISLKDVSILIAVFLSGLYWTFEFDIFKNSDGVSVHEHTIELDEALLLGGIMTFGLLLFSIRRYAEQMRETGRRVAAEQQVRTLAFQDALTGLPNRRQFDDALKAASLPCSQNSVLFTQGQVARGSRPTISFHASINSWTVSFISTNDSSRAAGCRGASESARVVQTRTN